MSSHENLKVFQHARRLAGLIRQAVKHFPNDEADLARQLKRAADSVVLNIAEGNARGSNVDFRRFLETARGSFKEVEGGLLLAFDGDLVISELQASIEDARGQTGRTLIGLLKAVNQRIDAGEKERFHRTGAQSEDTAA